MEVVFLEPKYKRVILKLSGEALAGPQGFGIDNNTVNLVAGEIKGLIDLGVQVAVVIGGGNFWRGRSSEDMDRSTADYIGMMATVMNALGLQEAVERHDMQSRVMSAIEMRQISEPYIRRKAVRHLEKGRVVIFAAGTGNPFFSTDTAASLRAAEIEADIILLAKKVDAVYDSDPLENPDAKSFDKLTFAQVLEKGLRVMDTTAITLCMENNIPIHVFGLKETNNINKVIYGEEIGTIIREAF
jgi:uridylate kinase